MFKIVLCIALMIFSNILLAAVSQTGVISLVYVSSDSFAITLKDPLTENFKSNCPAANPFIGASLLVTPTTNSSAQLAALLSAQARSATVTVVAEGCQGGWHKFKDLYIAN